MDLSRKIINGCFIRKNDSLVEMESKSLDIIGKQCGLLFNFQIKQIFTHSEKKSAEVHYFFSNDLKTCLNGLSFLINNKPIRPHIIPKKSEVMKGPKNVNKKKFTIFSTKKENGITQIALGNVPPNKNCEVYLFISMNAQLTKENSFFLKFPFDIYTPKGSSGSSIYNSPNFSFKLQNFDTPQISKIWSNFKSGIFNEKIILNLAFLMATGSQNASNQSKNDIEFTIQKIPTQENKSLNSMIETDNLSEIQYKPRNGFDFMKLIRLQNIIGYWENLNEINSIIGIEINDIPEIKIDDMKLYKRCIATIIAVSTLHAKSPEAKDAWCMIEEKAINWLKSVLQNIDINHIISKVEKIFKNSQ